MHQQYSTLDATLDFITLPRFKAKLLALRAVRAVVFRILYFIRQMFGTFGRNSKWGPNPAPAGIKCP